MNVARTLLRAHFPASPRPSHRTSCQQSEFTLGPTHGQGHEKNRKWREAIQGGASLEDLRGVRAPLRLAQEVGTGLGKRKVLLRPVQEVTLTAN
jgi:hypothetical protein